MVLCGVFWISVLIVVIGVITSEYTAVSGDARTTLADSFPHAEQQRNIKDDTLPHPIHSAAVIEKKDTEKVLRGGGFGGGGGGGGGGASVVMPPSPEAEEKIDPPMTTLGQQYPDAVEQAVKEAVSTEKSNAGTAEPKATMTGDKLPVDPDRVFMGGAVPSVPDFSGSIAAPDPNPTQHSPSDPNGHSTIINPVVTHLVDAINAKSVSTEEALQMMNDFVSGNQDMSKAAKNVEGMLSQISSQRRNSGATVQSDTPLPALGAPPIPLPETQPMLPGLPAQDDSHFYNPGTAIQSDKDDAHFFNPGDPTPSTGIGALTNPGASINNLNAMATPDKDTHFFSGGATGGNQMQNQFLNSPAPKRPHADHFHQLPDPQSFVQHAARPGTFLQHSEQRPGDTISSQHVFDHNDNAQPVFTERGGYVAQDMTSGTMQNVGQQQEENEMSMHAFGNVYGNDRGLGRQVGVHRNQPQRILADNLETGFHGYGNSNLHKSMGSNQADAVTSFFNGRDSSNMMDSEHQQLPSTDLMGNIVMSGNSGMAGNSHIDLPRGGMGANNQGNGEQTGGGNHPHDAAIHFFERGNSGNMVRNNPIQSFMGDASRYEDNSEAELPQGHLMSSEFTSKGIGLTDSPDSTPTFARKFQTPHNVEEAHSSGMLLKKTKSKTVPGARKHNVIADMYADSIFPEDITDIDSLQGSLQGKTLSNYYKSHEEEVSRRSFKPEDMQHIKASFPLEGSVGSAGPASDTLGEVRSSVPRYAKGSTNNVASEKPSRKDHVISGKPSRKDQVVSGKSSRKDQVTNEHTATNNTTNNTLLTNVHTTSVSKEVSNVSKLNDKSILNPKILTDTTQAEHANSDNSTLDSKTNVAKRYFTRSNIILASKKINNSPKYRMPPFPLPLL